MPVRDGPRDVLARSVACDRIHSAYLFAGPGEAPREAALWFARALACQAAGQKASEDEDVTRPCEACASCRRSRPGEPLPLDGTGKDAPLYRHVGDHPDLFWVERGCNDTRVRIAQIRALQHALHLRAVEGGRRAAVIADAEWLNLEAQNALLRTLEEPPPATHFVLVTASPAGLAATVRSRCQRVAFPLERAPDPGAEGAPETARAIADRLARLPRQSLPELLDWAEEFRGARALAAAGVLELLGVASAWLHAGVCRDAASDGGQRAVLPGRKSNLDSVPMSTFPMSTSGVAPRLEAWSTLQACRKALVQRNANPQLVAERALLALREALA
jgi:DNA polymerase-3 subunit delta'